MAGPDTGARRAALLLHGLSLPVQRQVLAKLSAGEAARVRPLLDELAKLDIPREIARQFPESVPLRPAGATVSLRDRVEQLSAADVERALRPCAPVTVASLLRIEDWPWKKGVLDCMDPVRRAEVVRCMRIDSPLPAPGVQRKLSELLCAQAENPWTR